MYEFDSVIRYSETDPDGVLTVESLIDYFQDCSTFQTHAVGAGLEFLKEQGLIWVLNSWQIDILRLPHLYESVTIGTIPYLLKGFAGHRNFYMKDADGRMCAVANSLWTLFDLKTMYPARISPSHEARYEIGEKLTMTYLPRKITLPKEGGSKAEPITVLRHHLDSNGHVNNGQYVRMALDVLEAGAGDGFSPEHISRLRAEYRQQAHTGDILCPVLYRTAAPEGGDIYTVDLRLSDASCCVVELS